MQVLEKILEDIRGLEKILITDPMKLMVDMGEVEDIIRKHVSGKDTGVPTNDGWIPADEVLPEAGEHVLVSFRSAGFLPATAIISENGRWNMLQGAKGFNDVTEDVIAWRPLPEPYRPERNLKEAGGFGNGKNFSRSD